MALSALLPTALMFWRTPARRQARLVRIEHNGKRTVLAREGLEHPGGVTVAPNDDIYLTNRTTSLGEANGQLLRLRPGRS
ncbi:hypothetical protein [Streptomyces sp. NPDC047985]|uniref:hypothetical protein n=1 Tax=Streptomyces sp. NPDC047985 TaxID=3155384 RepID=UPI00343F1CE4